MSKQRSTYNYLSGGLYSQGQKGDWNYQLTPVYGVFLMNFKWKDVKEQHLREDVCLYNMQTKEVFSDSMRMTFIKIPMLEKSPEECRTTLERWIYILKNMEKMEAIPKIFKKEPIFMKLDRVAKYGALTDSQKKAYNDSLKAYRDAYAIYETERTEGRAEGRAEEKIDIAKKMLTEGISYEMISTCTGLSLQEIQNLK